MTVPAAERAAGFPRAPYDGQDGPVLRLELADAMLFGPGSLLAGTGTGSVREEAPAPAAGADRLLRRLQAAGVRAAVVL